MDGLISRDTVDRLKRFVDEARESYEAYRSLPHRNHTGAPLIGRDVAEGNLLGSVGALLFALDKTLNEGIYWELEGGNDEARS